MSSYFLPPSFLLLLAFLDSEAAQQLPLPATPLKVRQFLSLPSCLRFRWRGLFPTKAYPTLRMFLLVLLYIIVAICLTIAFISAGVMVSPFKIVRCSNSKTVVSTSTIFKLSPSKKECTAMGSKHAHDLVNPREQLHRVFVLFPSLIH